MSHQVADRLGDCFAPRPSPRSGSRLGEPCADRFKVLFRGGRKGDGARHLRWRGYCAGRRGGRSPSPSQASSQASRSRPVRPWPASSCALALAIISASRASRRARAAGVSGGGSRGPWAGDGSGMGPNVGRPGAVCQRGHPGRTTCGPRRDHAGTTWGRPKEQSHTPMHPRCRRTSPEPPSDSTRDLWGMLS